MNIYVGNLAWGMTDDDCSRGFGFVEMTSEEAGEKAVAALNGKDLKGREVKVNKAKPREER